MHAHRATIDRTNPAAHTLPATIHRTPGAESIRQLGPKANSSVSIETSSSSSWSDESASVISSSGAAKVNPSAGAHGDKGMREDESGSMEEEDGGE